MVRLVEEPAMHIAGGKVEFDAEDLRLLGREDRGVVLLETAQFMINCAHTQAASDRLEANAFTQQKLAEAEFLAQTAGVNAIEVPGLKIGFTIAGSWQARAARQEYLVREFSSAFTSLLPSETTDSVRMYQRT